VPETTLSAAHSPARAVNECMTRLRRTERRRGVRLALTPRDVHLLRVLNRFRLARTSEVAAVVFPGVHVHTVSRRLRRLYDASYLAASAPDRTAENVYAVGPRGRAWLREHGIAPQSAPRGSIQHHLGCVQVWVQVAAVVGRLPNVVLERVAPHWQTTARVGGLVSDSESPLDSALSRCTSWAP